MKLQTLRPKLGKVSAQVRQLASGTRRKRGSSLMTLRAQWFAKHPLCVECDKQGRVTAAQELDHVIPLWQGGADDAANLQGLCIPCHREKTAAEAGRRYGNG